MRRRLRRHPRGRPARARRDRRLRPRAGRRGHPPRRPGRARPQAGRRRRSPQRAEELGVPVLKPEHPRDPDFQAALRGAAPRTAARSSPTARCCRSPRSTSPPHGWVNLHFSLLPAWRGAAPVQHALWAGDEVTGATTFRIVKELDAGPTYGVMTERIRPDDTAGDLLARLAEGGAGLLVRHPRRHRGRLARGPRRSRRTASRFAPKITVEDARVDWTAARRRRSTARIRACTPGAGRLDDLRRRADQARPGPLGRRPRAARARASSRSAKNAVLVGTGTDARAARRGARRSARSRCRPPTGPAASGSSRGARLGART